MIAYAASACLQLQESRCPHVPRPMFCAHGGDGLKSGQTHFPLEANLLWRQTGRPQAPRGEFPYRAISEVMPLTSANLNRTRRLLKEVKYGGKCVQRHQIIGPAGSCAIHSAVGDLVTPIQRIRLRSCRRIRRPYNNLNEIVGTTKRSI